MDASRFDNLARLLAGRHRRRGVLKAVASSALALVGVKSVEANQTLEQCGNWGERCVVNGDCCARSCCGHVCCGDGQKCANGRCRNSGPQPSRLAAEAGPAKVAGQYQLPADHDAIVVKSLVGNFLAAPEFQSGYEISIDAAGRAKTTIYPEGSRGTANGGPTSAKADEIATELSRDELERLLGDLDALGFFALPGPHRTAGAGGPVSEATVMLADGTWEVSSCCLETAEQQQRFAAIQRAIADVVHLVPPDDSTRPSPPPPARPVDPAALDLPAMALRPADLEAEGVQEHGMANGIFTEDPATAGDFLRSWRGDPDGATTAALRTAAPALLYLQQLVQTGHPWDSSSGTADQIVSYLFAFASDDKASAAFPVLAEAWRSGEMHEIATDAAAGDERILVSGSGREERGNRAEYQRIDLMFRSGNIIAGVSDERFAGLPIAPTLVETLGTRQMARIADSRATGGPGLSRRIVRLAIPGENAIWDLYDVRDGGPLRQYDEAPDAFATRTATVSTAGMIDEYRLEQQYLGPFGGSQSPLAFYSARLATFADAKAASAYVQQAADRLKQSSAENLAEVSNLPRIGDEAMAFSYQHIRPDGVRFRDYRVYARVGGSYFTVALNTTEPVDGDAVNELASKQAACLAGSVCLAPYPVPAALDGSVALPSAPMRIAPAVVVPRG